VSAPTLLCQLEHEPIDYDAERGQCAYHAYSDATGHPLPHWDELSEEIQRCWIQTAAAVCLQYGAIY
jgi:hypothetical protein